ncbi:selenocysteine-specific translation elongation factor [Piscibacillus sp. B03]|uniref:selenocysteine-specific translation elongation factor n=1 Tax=Piscibacillus sp. B03 TaxID=3457430 RepID=UPI003FCCC65F
MNKQHLTIGLAGHIDHGKTELVKALTNVDTDRLKEEKERNISIELGYAPLINEEHLSVSIIDVPGHEKFIRQMIAGVSSIDLTLLVIAANEGIMPQTLEHMEVLKHLGLHNVIIVITKIDQADQDLKSIVIEDLKDEMNGTFFENSPVFEVDSISKIGVEELKQSILNVLGKIVAKQTNGDLFLPVDQSFHLHGIGTIARGTVSQGSIRDGQTVYLMPHNIKAQVKGVHHFNEPVNRAVAGQRAAVALSHINISDVNRGVVITDHPGKSTNRVDIELDISKLL